MKKLLLAVVASLMTAVAFAQGVTTSSMGGQISDNAGEPLPGANVVAIHLPSGTVYGAAADFDGYYRLAGLRPGGPYKVTISYVGFNDFVKENIFLRLGESFRISPKMSESATALDEVVLTATPNGVFNSNKTGGETTISNRQIQELPSASRSLADFVRLTPQAQLSEGNDGFEISIAGQNNRYNAIYIDGAINNDVFGLAGSGTNGGQTGVNPFSVDALESITVQLAPYDVRIAGFAGGAISAVTRSGTNEWEGSAYYFFRNEKLAGKTPERNLGTGERERLPEFDVNTYGVRLGGPIIKDKLFFFVNYERQEREEPEQPFDPSIYIGDTNEAGLNDLRSFIQTAYGYDVGNFVGNTNTLESDILNLKLNWNINDRNRVSLRYGYVGAENIEARTSDFNSIGFQNGTEFFDTKTNSFAFEWNYNGNKTANEMKIGYTRVRDDRDPLGMDNLDNAFPSVNIIDGDGFITLGAERFSTANILDQDVFTFTNNFDIYSGKHTITLGTHNEYSEVKNLFFANNFGRYVYTDVQGFINNDPAAIDSYDIGYSLVGDGTPGDDSAGASEFEILQLGFYVSDEIQFSDKLRMTAGVRVDFPIWSDGPVNEDFNTRTVGLLQAAGKNLQGARVGQGPRTQAHVSPRVGFNWDVFGNRTTQIRGGFGIFTSRLPLVWPGGTYNNNGITGGSADERDVTLTGFQDDVRLQPFGAQPGTGETGGNIDLIAEDFMLPQVFKYSIAVDQKLPWWNLIASAEVIWNDNINAVFYENLNIGEPVGTLSGADNRLVYDRFSRIDSEYGGIYLLSNTGEGNSVNTTFTLTKPFDNGLSASASWNWGNANSIFDGTSSQNSSQWRNIQTVNGKNAPTMSRAGFAQGHRFIANVTYAHEWSENVKTTIGLFYTGSQSPYISYVYNDGGGDILGDDSRDNALIYIPRDASEINLLEGANGLTSAQQWTALDAFISSNDYLNSRRGQYAERNGAKGTRSDIVDLKFLQDVSFLAGDKKNTLQFSIDIFNFTNLLNKDWGEQRFIGSQFPGAEFSLLRTETAGPNPVFSYNPENVARRIQADDGGINSSRWQAQIGLRYIFN